MAHAECSPSQLSRVMKCPGSRRLMRNAKRKSSTYADEGTMLHDVIAYQVFQKYPHLATNSIELDPEVDLTLEQQLAISDAFGYLEQLIDQYEKEGIESIEIEVHNSLNWSGMPEVAGTCDILIKLTGGIRIVLDWKFGKGIFVGAERNTQLMAYAAMSFNSAKEMRETDTIQLHVVQPRLNNYSTWSLSGSDLVTWMNQELRPKVYASRNPEAECSPGEDQCRWCVGATCKARAEFNISLAKEIFAPYAKKEKTVDDFMQLHELTDLLQYAESVKKFISQLINDMITECTAGNGVPGYKVVSGRSNRKWKDENQAIDFLHKMVDEEHVEYDDCFKTKPLSVAQAEKLAKGCGLSDEFKELWEKPAGRPTLVKESDPRESIKSTAANAFSEHIKEKS